MGWLRLSPQEEKYWERFHTGDQIDVMVEPHLADVFQGEIISREEEKLEISLPRKGGVFLDLSSGPSLVIHVYTGYGIFRFRTTLASQKNQRGGTITLMKPRKIEHIQRRQFYRLSIEVPVQYAESSLAVDSLNAETFSGITRNISEGGMLLVTSTVHTASTLLKVLVNLDTNVWVNSIAQVRRQKQLGIGDKMLTSLQFVKISDKDRDAIRRYVLTHTVKGR